MNKKGFTLIEIIATVIILGLISLLSFPIILNLVKNEEVKLNEANIALIKTAASQYTSEYENAFPKIEGNYYCITLEELVKEDYLLNHNDEFSLDTNVLVTVNTNKKYDYEIVSECDASKIIPSIVVKNKNGVFNSEGWANKNFYVSIVGTGSSYYKCVGTTECIPDILFNKSSGDEYIVTEGVNVVCAKAINNFNESEIVCSDEFKLDTISPTTPVISMNDISTLKKEIVLTTKSTDVTSGISHYEYALTSSFNNPSNQDLIITDGKNLELTLTASDKYIYYRAVDKAGNKSDYAYLQLGRGDFNFAINEYGKVDIVNIDLPDNYTIKYLKGNKEATDVINSGTNITSSNKFDAYQDDIYTVTAYLDSAELVTKKIYVYNFSNAYIESPNITLSGITKIDNVLTYGATATASLSSSKLKINVTDATEYTDHYCDSGYHLEGDVCVTDATDLYYEEEVSITIECVDGLWNPVYTTYDDVCDPGYVTGSVPGIDNSDESCAPDGVTGTTVGWINCSPDTGEYSPNEQLYYEYTIGVEVE